MESIIYLILGRFKRGYFSVIQTNNPLLLIFYGLHNLI